MGLTYLPIKGRAKNCVRPSKPAGQPTSDVRGILLLLRLIGQKITDIKHLEPTTLFLSGRQHQKNLTIYLQENGRIYRVHPTVKCNLQFKIKSGSEYTYTERVSRDTWHVTSTFMFGCAVGYHLQKAKITKQHSSSRRISQSSKSARIEGRPTTRALGLFVYFHNEKYWCIFYVNAFCSSPLPPARTSGQSWSPCLVARRAAAHAVSTHDGLRGVLCRIYHLCPSSWEICPST